jgi:carbonic anhydrase
MIDRRPSGLTWIVAGVLLGAGSTALSENTPAAASHATEEAASLSPEESLERLRAGNEAFRRGLVNADHVSDARRRTLALGQHPFAIILSCADSRVPPEAVFAQGLGDLFTVRVAGNVAEPATVASVEYAAAHLGSRLLLVLGHSQCGAVKAAVARASDTPAIRELVAAIRPAVDASPPAAPVDDVVRANVRRVQVELLRQSALLAGMVREGKLQIVGAVYDLASGEVRVLEVPAAK